jgi:hypothetical protein
MDDVFERGTGLFAQGHQEFEASLAFETSCGCLDNYRKILN